MGKSGVDATKPGDPDGIGRNGLHRPRKSKTRSISSKMGLPWPQTPRYEEIARDNLPDRNIPASNTFRPAEGSPRDFCRVR
jgi:hypothetical protein